MWTYAHISSTCTYLGLSSGTLESSIPRALSDAVFIRRHDRACSVQSAVRSCGRSALQHHRTLSSSAFGGVSWVPSLGAGSENVILQEMRDPPLNAALSVGSEPADYVVASYTGHIGLAFSRTADNHLGSALRLVPRVDCPVCQFALTAGRIFVEDAENGRASLSLAIGALSY